MTHKASICFFIEEFWIMVHVECRLNRRHWRSKKVVQVVQIGWRGRGGGVWRLFGQNPTKHQFSLRKPSLRRFVMWESKNDFSSIPPSLTAGVDEKAGYAISRIESLTFARLFTELNSLKNWAHWTLFVIFILLLKTTWVWILWNTYIFVEPNEYF